MISTEPSIDEAEKPSEQSTETSSQRQVLHDRDFVLLWIGQGISLLGDHFYLIALPILALDLSNGSGTALGLAVMLAGIPRALLMLVGGALSDRLSPRNVMIGSNAASAVLVGIMAFLVMTDTARLWHLYAIAFCFGFVDAFFFPAFRAICLLW